MAEYIDGGAAERTSASTSRATTSKRKTYPQSKYWLITLNNPKATDETYKKRFEQANVKYTFQRECAASGTYHIQAFIWLGTRRRRTAISELFGDGENPHCEPCKSPRDAEKYCRKAETRYAGPYSNIEAKEVANIGQGSRTEIAAACEAIREGARLETVATEHSTTYVKYYRGLIQLHAIIQPKRCFKSTVLWLYGETGSGKSRCARQVADTATANGWSSYSKSGSNKWFDGYGGDQCLIWDELTEEFPITLLLQILDRYELQVETKGGYVNFNPKLIIITTNYSPGETFININEKHMQALHRRINHCLEFQGPIYSDLK